MAAIYLTPYVLQMRINTPQLLKYCIYIYLYVVKIAAKPVEKTNSTVSSGKILKLYVSTFLSLSYKYHGQHEHKTHLASKTARERISLKSLHFNHIGSYVDGHFGFLII